MQLFHGEVAIVTGGSTGIGEAISKKLAREGARVVVAGLPHDPVEDVVEEIRAAGGEAAGFAGDLSEGEAASACVQRASRLKVVCLKLRLRR